MSRFPVSCTVLKVALASFAAAPVAWAGSFYLQEQSVSGLGAANAGQSAVASDATTVSSNPAGMTQLTRSQLTGGGSLLLRTSSLKNDGSYVQLPDSLGGARLPLSGNDRKERFHPSLIPNFSGVWVVNPELRFGFALTAPFGLVNKYGSDFFGRYDSQKSKLETQNISLTGAYKISPNFSFGGGIDIQRASTVLTTAVPAIANLAKLPAAQRQAYLRSIGGVSGLYNPQTDSLFTVRADGWSVGGNLGLTWKPAQDWTLGVTYRSAIKHTVNGDLSVVQGGSVFQSGPAKISVTTPDIIGLGAAWQIDPRWTLLAQANRFYWRNFDKIDVKLNGASFATEQQDYRNSYSVALGAHYRWSDRLILRSGTQFDVTPTVDAHRSTRVPDSNRVWLALGGGYAISDQLSLDVAYAHLFIKDTKVDLMRKTTGARVKAKQQDTMTDIFSVGLTYKF